VLPRSSRRRRDYELSPALTLEERESLHQEGSSVIYHGDGCTTHWWIQCFRKPRCNTRIRRHRGAEDKQGMLKLEFQPSRHRPAPTGLISRSRGNFTTRLIVRELDSSFGDSSMVEADARWKRSQPSGGLVPGKSRLSVDINTLWQS